MLLTKQQKYLLAVLEKLGCAEQRQLAALLQKTFAFSSLDNAVRVTNACKFPTTSSVTAENGQFRSR